MSSKLRALRYSHNKPSHFSPFSKKKCSYVFYDYEGSIIECRDTQFGNHWNDPNCDEIRVMENQNFKKYLNTDKKFNISSKHTYLLIMWTLIVQNPNKTDIFQK
jgi:hypothetical protein